jgi:hypothetical protein
VRAKDGEDHRIWETEIERQRAELRQTVRSPARLPPTRCAVQVRRRNRSSRARRPRRAGASSGRRVAADGDPEGDPDLRRPPECLDVTGARTGFDQNAGDRSRSRGRR